ncbi:ABC transporter related protein [Caldalkalibacillus thermarum TA2.A1]|uniref:ABC transporter related protein n=2 Tax=Caldalkalibacillus thermarum (strain TA2.A1) TaxID=986075 RepID=F5L3D5_CALTT|nr:ATP-binding cassette domain-containing protein [Caldalkalibacillus thermarum]EGL84150.1 ABC transporter related protein [Caldalkalibacillus thermarum TA2.A1]
MIIYEMKDIHYTVREKKQDKTILHVEHLSLKEGEILGIIGPNGAGKSTLLKVMALLDPPASGSITYRGQKINPHAVPLTIRHNMATVFQQSLLLDMTVYQNVALGLKFRKVKKREQKRRVAEWLNRFHIGHLAKQHAHTLSGGEAQRVSLARALVLQPDILFLDEPFSALDFPTKAALMQDLKQVLRETKTTTLFVSHDLMEVKYMTDRLIVLIDGQIAQAGTPEMVIQSPNERTQAFLNQWRAFTFHSFSL